MHQDTFIEPVLRQLLGLITPQKVILFHKKQNLAGQTSSFKLCVVADVKGDEKQALERRLYLQIDSEVPYDILLYTPAEFETLRCQPGSFANKIDETGCVLFG